MVQSLRHPPNPAAVQSRISAESGGSLNSLSHPVWERTGRAIRGAPYL
jgi:hypothetical protein